MTRLAALFSFAGHMRRTPYALSSLGIFLAQYALVAGLFAACGQQLVMGWRFYLTPMSALVSLEYMPVAALPLAFGLTLLAAWLLALLAFRRAQDANVNRWIAAAASAPVIEIGAILFLSAAPSRPVPSPNTNHGALDWPMAVQGGLAGAGLTVFAVAIGALVFGTYGFGIFVLAPLLIGAATAFLANRKHDIGYGATFKLIVAAMALGGIGLVAFALEGIVCIVLAFPLALAAAAVGGALGRAAAFTGSRSARSALSCVALLPLVFAAEGRSRR